MRFFLLSSLAAALLAVVGPSRSQDKNDPLSEHIAPGKARTPEEERKAFHLPPGFEIQLVASEPDIHKPMNIAFDDRGRLWVTESVEYPFPAPANKKGRDAVKILEDFGPDGKARKITTFADGLNIPIGVLPLTSPIAPPRRGVGGEGALVYSIPNIWKLTDTDSKGHANKREVFVGTFETRDTHGMTNSFTWGFDGWIYATHGFSNTSKIRGADGQAITLNSGNTYRMKPDGAHVEQFTWGQVNPFGLTFSPLGDLFSADCHTKPIMMLLRGGYYDSFGKPHDGLGYAPEMMGAYPDSTAIAGIAYYEADHFPHAYRGQVFIGDVVTCRVNEFRLEWRGSSPWATKHDFLTSDDRWFRPVDIKLGPDGALYIADFYNRIIGHYEVPLDHPGRDRTSGRIWRIVCRGKDGKVESQVPPDLTKATVAELVDRLGQINLANRIHAMNQLVQHGGKDVVDAVRSIMGPSGSSLQREYGLWVLERMGVLDKDTLAAAAEDDERGVRVHAMRVLSERKELADKEHTLLLSGLKDKDPFVQRSAADALGKHENADNLAALLELRHSVPSADTHLLHTVRMAIRGTLRLAESWKQLTALNERDRQAIADVALGVPTADSAKYLVERLKERARDRGNLLASSHHIARYGDGDVTRRLIEFVRAHEPADKGLQAALFQSVEQGVQERGAGLSEEARAWGRALANDLLNSPMAGETLTGVRMAGSLRMKETQDKLAAIAGRPSPSIKGTRPPDNITSVQSDAFDNVRAEAIKSLVLLDSRKHTELLGRILANASEPLGLREQACHTLASVNHADTQAELVKALPLAPARLQSVIAADLAGSPSGAEKLLEAVTVGKASARLLQERFVELRLAAAKLPDFKKRIAKLTEGLPPADQKMQELFRRRKAGFAASKPDAEMGAKVYEKNCANCHQLGGKGAKIGPQLDGVGIRGVDRLLEDILDPNRNVDQAFRATIFALKNGQSVTGLVLREEGEIYVLADDKGKEVRVPKNTVEERSVSQLSPMPANLVDQITEMDFYHLMAYLLQQRAPKEGK
jgi:putative heme-binding domain-containing protein